MQNRFSLASRILSVMASVSLLFMSLKDMMLYQRLENLNTLNLMDLSACILYLAAAILLMLDFFIVKFDLIDKRIWMLFFCTWFWYKIFLLT